MVNQPKKMITIEFLIKNFVNILPIEQHPFIDSPAYLQFCSALYAVLKAPVDERPELQQELKHARDIFEDLCRTEIAREERRLEEERRQQEERQARIERMATKKPTLAELGWGSIKQ